MAWSNIFCQMIGETGPIIGEGLLVGWQTSIELDAFSWSADVDLTTDEDRNFGEELAHAAETANPFRGVEDPVNAKRLILKKRFDIASADMFSVMDQGKRLISVSITVLHMAHGGGLQAIHQPGFVVLCTDCVIKSIDVQMQRGQKGLDVRETVEIDYGSITFTYLRTLPGLGQNQVPMPPFTYVRDTPPSAFGI